MQIPDGSGVPLEFVDGRLNTLGSSVNSLRLGGTGIVQSLQSGDTPRPFTVGQLFVGPGANITAVDMAKRYDPFIFGSTVV
jgi:hypothetical protein